MHARKILILSLLLTLAGCASSEQRTQSSGERLQLDIVKPEMQYEPDHRDRDSDGYLIEP